MNRIPSTLFAKLVFAARALLAMVVTLATTGCMTELAIYRHAIHEEMYPTGYIVGEDGAIALAAGRVYRRDVIVNSGGNNPPIHYGTEPTWIILPQESIERLRAGTIITSPKSKKVRGDLVLALGEPPLDWRWGKRDQSLDELHPGIQIVPDIIPSYGAPVESLPPSFWYSSLRGLDVPFEYDIGGELVSIDMRTLLLKSRRWKRTMPAILFHVLWPVALAADLSLVGGLVGGFFQIAFLPGESARIGYRAESVFHPAPGAPVIYREKPPYKRSSP